MKALKLLLSALLISGLSYGQGEPQVPKDPKAKEVLDAVSAKTKTYSGIDAAFTLTLKDDAAGIDEKQNGTIQVKDGKYAAEVNGQKIISDGSTVWTVIDNGGDCEVQIDDAPDEDEEEEGAINMAKIFTIYETGFKYKYDGESTVGGVKHHSIKLFPVQANGKEYHQIKLLIDDSKKQIKEITILQKEGGSMIYALTKFNGAASIADSKFQYDKSMGCEEIDLR